jgi:hypothetical protein
MPMQPELAELLDQQQRDRRQLLFYSARLDEQVRTTAQLTGRIAELTEAIEATKVKNRRELEEIQSRHAAEVAESKARYAAEIGELVAWRDTMMQSRGYRLMLLYGRLYRAPVLGWPLRFLQRAVGAVYVGLKSFRQR